MLRKLRVFIIASILVLLMIPTQAQNDVVIADIIFARDISLQTNEPIMPLIVFPTTAPVVIAVLDIQGLRQGSSITSQWVRDGEQQTASVYTHNSDIPDFRMWTNLSAPRGIEPGTWTLRVLLDGTVVKTGTFIVTDEPYIFPIFFGTLCGNFSGELFGHTNSFDPGTQHIFAQIRYTNFPAGTEIEGVWGYNGTILEGQNLPIRTTLTGSGQRCFRVGDPRGLASGEYSFDIRLGGTVLSRSSAVIGVAEPDFNESGD
jgi:hypothetical protein